jgi:hypothetical protein
LILSLFILSLFTIFVGFVFSKYNTFLNIPLNYLTIDIPLFIKLIPLLFFVLLLPIYLIQNIIISKPIRILILEKQYSLKLLYQSFAGFIFSIAYRVFFKIFDYGFLDLLSPITGHHLYDLSIYISKYLSPTYYISLLLFLIFILIL